MIPRTKVNYFFSELVRASFVFDWSKKHRNKLINRLKQMFGFEHLILTGSGRGALYYLLKALPQPRVIVPAYTCKAVVEAAKLAGKIIVHVDAESDGFNINTDELIPLLNRDCIVIATHQFGIPCDIETIQSLCISSGAFMIEDVAAAFGTRFKGQLTGTWGDAAFFSFDSTKLINVPLKAGFLALRSAELFEKVLIKFNLETSPMTIMKKIVLILQGFIFLLIENKILYRIFHKIMFEWQGRFTADGPGLNLYITKFYTDRMAEWQAFLALRQLERLNTIISRRREIYRALGEGLRDNPILKLPPQDYHEEWACIRFPIRVRGDKLKFYHSAAKQGVDFAFSFTFIDCPQHMAHARKLATSVLNLPFYHKLTQAELDETIRIVKGITQ